MFMCMYVYSIFVLSYVGRADHSSKESYRMCIRDYETEILGQGPAVKLLKKKR
jgi:hypothetical protein